MACEGHQIFVNGLLFIYLFFKFRPQETGEIKIDLTHTKQIVVKSSPFNLIRKTISSNQFIGSLQPI